MIFLFFIIIGLGTGILAGLLGIGGGVITVPALYYIFYFYGFPKDLLMHMAVATALATSFLTSVGSTWSHHKKQAILPHVVKLIAPGLLIGCICGAILTFFLSSPALRIIFGIMSLLFASYFSLPKLPQLNIAPHPNRSLAYFGFLIGSLSTLLGVGGGIFVMPLLLGYHLSLKNTIANSSASTLVTTMAGSIIYLIIARQNPTPYTLGYIDIPAFLIVGLCSMFTTSLGCKLSHTLPPLLIKRIFAICLGCTGLLMIFGR